MTKGKVEVTRSFSYKLGQPNYSSVDFSCTVTDTCERKDVTMIGEGLAAFCQSEVKKSIAEFLEAQEAKKKAELETFRDKVEGKQNRKADTLEHKDGAKQSAELSAGDIEIVPEN